jgi:hypothetical protein
LLRGERYFKLKNFFTILFCGGQVPGRSYSGGTPDLPSQHGPASDSRSGIPTLLFQGSVQPKLRWVKISASCWVLAWHRILFWFLICCHLVLDVFPFLFSTEQFLSSFRTTRLSVATTLLRFAYSFMSILLCCANTDCVVIFTPRTGEVWQLKKSVNFPYLTLRVRPTSPTCAEFDSALIILSADYKLC